MKIISNSTSLIRTLNCDFVQIQSVENQKYCIDTLGAEREEVVGLYFCKNTLRNPGYRQSFRLGTHRDILIEDSNSDCLDVSHGKVLLFSCKFKQENQYFRYDLGTKQIFCGRKRDNNCIDMDPKFKTVFVSKCNSLKNSQKWNWGFTNETMLNNWTQFGKEIIDKDELNDLREL